MSDSPLVEDNPSKGSKRPVVEYFIMMGITRVYSFTSKHAPAEGEDHKEEKATRRTGEIVQ